MEPLTRPEPIGPHHDVSGFASGKTPLDDYLRRFALVNHRNDSARTYVTSSGTRVVGYYSLAAASVERSDVPSRVAQGLAARPAPLTLLARLAVDRSEQGQGLGRALLKDAVLRHLAAGEIVGSRGLLVHAIDEEAARFYARFGSAPSPIDAFHLIALRKDLRASLGL